MSKSIFIRLLAVTALIGIAACNTIEGAGKDIEAGGNKLEHSAKNNN